MSKINISDLSQVLVEKHGLTKEQAETFIKQMFDVANDGLRNDRQLKIKGLGTFKLTRVKDRESVDVNTGERIVIEGRDKINYVPDNILRDIVNKPFAQFETVVINSGVEFGDEEENQTAETPAMSVAAPVAESAPVVETTPVAETAESQNEVPAEVAVEESETPVAAMDEEVADEPVSADPKEETTVEENPEGNLVVEDVKEQPVAVETEVAPEVEDIVQEEVEVEAPAESEVSDSQEHTEPHVVSFASDTTVPSEEPVADERVETESDQSVQEETTEEQSEPVASSLDEGVEESAEDTESAPTEEPEENVAEEVAETTEEEIPEAVVEETESAEESEDTPENPVAEESEPEVQQFSQSSAEVPAESVPVQATAEEPEAASDDSEPVEEPFYYDDEPAQITFDKKWFYCGIALIAILIGAVGYLYYQNTELERKYNEIYSYWKKRDAAQHEKALKDKALQDSMKKAGNEAAKREEPVKEETEKEEKNSDEEVSSSDYNKDPRVRTGAYKIVGVDKTVTAKEGQTIESISKAYLGSGMECYVEALNGKEVSAGQKVKIPKLQLKKRK